MLEVEVDCVVVVPVAGFVVVVVVVELVVVVVDVGAAKGGAGGGGDAGSADGDLGGDGAVEVGVYDGEGEELGVGGAAAIPPTDVDGWARDDAIDVPPRTRPRPSSP